MPIYPEYEKIYSVNYVCIHGVYQIQLKTILWVHQNRIKCIVFITYISQAIFKTVVGGRSGIGNDDLHWLASFLYFISIISAF